MKVTVNSGQLMDLAKKALNAIFKGLDECMRNMEGSNTKYDFNVSKTKDVEEDGVPGKYYLFEVGDSGTVLDVTLFKIEDNEDSFMIRIEGEGLDKFEKGPIKQDEIEKYVTNYCDKYNLGAVEDSVDVYEHTKIRVTLQRVQGASEDSIELSAISANCNPKTASTALDTVLASEDFLELVTEEPTTFDIVEVNDEEYDVQPTEDSVEIETAYAQLLNTAVQTYHNLEYLKWASMSLGVSSNQLEQALDCLLWEVKDEYNTLGCWCVQYNNAAVNVLSLKYDNVLSTECVDVDTILQSAGSAVDEYIAALNLYYPNLPHEIQSMVDTWIRTLSERKFGALGSYNNTCSVTRL